MSMPLILNPFVCSHLRRSPSGWCCVEQCAARIVPHSTIHTWRGPAARAPGHRECEDTEKQTCPE